MMRRVMLVCLLIAVVATRPTQADLRAEVDRAIAASQLPAKSISVSIRDAVTGSPLVAVNDAAMMIPASNFKLLTTGTALDVLGADYRFETRLMYRDDQLVIVGDGDPGFGDPVLLGLMRDPEGAGLDIDDFLAIWVDAVVEAGIDSVPSVIVDDRIFDREFVHPGWPADQLNLHYCAQVAGLDVHTNLLHVYATPGRERANVSHIVPRAPWLQPINKSTSRRTGDARNDLWAARVPGSNRMTFYGNVRFPYEKPVRVTIDDIPSFFARLLETRLEAAGVEVGEARAALPDETLDGGTPVGPVISTPISTIVTRCNRDSQNLYAECLIKRVGAEISQQPGSWTNGGAVIRHTVHDRLRGAYTSDLQISDGSGLSRGNRVTARLMTAWLASMHQDEELADVFERSFAVARESGTLRKRFKNANLLGSTVLGKSGYIDRVSCLTGYVISPDGRCYSYSVLANDLAKPGSVGTAKRLQEAVVLAIAQDHAVVRTSLGSD